KYSQSFQSRLGNDKWLEPYTDATLESLPSKGVKRLAVVTPAFVSDCLETLEEIGMEGAHQFKSKGGDDFFAVPCMNDDPEWVSGRGRSDLVRWGAGASSAGVRREGTWLRGGGGWAGGAPGRERQARGRGGAAEVTQPTTDGAPVCREGF